MKKLFIIFAIICLATPALAADWNFYGSSRIATWWVNDDYDVDGTQYDDDNGLQWENGGNSRFGANVKFNDQIGGAVELGFGPSVYARKLFGTYTFGGGSQLLLGQTYTPTALFYSNSVFGGDGDLLGIGEYYAGRPTMIQWKVAGFKIAAITPTVRGIDDPSIDFVIPKLEIGYGFKGDAFFMDAFAGYQTYEMDNGNGNKDYDIDAYIVGLGGGANFGAFFFKLQGHFGSNLGDYGSSGPYSIPATFIVNGAEIVNDEVVDADTYGLLGVIGFNASEMLAFEAGIGYQNYESDINNASDQSLMQIYVNSTINIAPGFFIVPEVGYVKTDPTVVSSIIGQDAEPSRFYLGAKWQINF